MVVGRDVAVTAIHVSQFVIVPARVQLRVPTFVGCVVCEIGAIVPMLVSDSCDPPHLETFCSSLRAPSPLSPTPTRPTQLQDVLCDGPVTAVVKHSIITKVLDAAGVRSSRGRAGAASSSLPPPPPGSASAAPAWLEPDPHSAIAAAAAAGAALPPSLLRPPRPRAGAAALSTTAQPYHTPQPQHQHQHQQQHQQQRRHGGRYGSSKKGAASGTSRDSERGVTGRVDNTWSLPQSSARAGGSVHGSGSVQGSGSRAVSLSGRRMSASSRGSSGRRSSQSSFGSERSRYAVPAMGPRVVCLI